MENPGGEGGLAILEFGGQGGDKHFGISEGKGGGVKILMPSVVWYGYFLESPIAEDPKMFGSYTNESTVGKKMAAVHFTTIPCEPNTAYETQGKPIFYNICPSTKDIVYRRFEDFITLLYLFMNVVIVLVR